MENLVPQDIERRASRMREMADRLGVDKAKMCKLSQGRAVTGARSNCANCQSVPRCLMWLDAPLTSGGTPVFCPNVPLFDLCKTD
ncbi:MAG: DUF6455 family protein [Hyphomicrobium sp.]|nr:hypothetical protein [Hyphomicrobium sp.]